MNSMIKGYLFLGALALAALYWITRSGNAGAVGLAVSQAAADMAGGVVQGASTAVGIPLTNEQKCANAMKNRDSLDVSLYCDAATFLKYEKDLMFGSDIAQIPITNNNIPLSQSGLIGVIN
jgi:hypothetical protein